jgi:hypothetical protein
MQRCKNKAIWLLVGLLFASSASLAGSNEYFLHSDDDGAFTAVEFTTCSTSIHPIAILTQRTQVEFDLISSNENCQLYEASTVTVDQSILVLLSKDGRNILLELAKSPSGIASVSPEIRSVLIFVAGLFVAMVGRVLRFLLDPIYNRIRIQMEYNATRKFFLSVSNSFDKDYLVSENLTKVANGDYLTNVLVTAPLRTKIKDLLINIDRWKRSEIRPSEFRDWLKKN